MHYPQLDIEWGKSTVKDVIGSIYKIWMYTADDSEKIIWKGKGKRE